LLSAIYTARTDKSPPVLKGKSISHLEIDPKVENYPGVQYIFVEELLKPFEK